MAEQFNLTGLVLVRGTSAEWAATNPVLAQGEVGIDLTLGEMRLGDGVTAWAGLTSIGAADPADVDAAIAAYLLAHPLAHAASHAAGQPDAITPASIGAQPAGSYATAAQGAKADSASQPGHTHLASAISDSTPAGRSILTATDALPNPAAASTPVTVTYDTQPLAMDSLGRLL